LGLKVSKKCYYDIKTFHWHNLNISIQKTQNVMLISKLLRKTQKSC
jgi:hypothetical protein